MVSSRWLLPRSNTYLSVFLFFSFHGSIAFLFSFFIFSTIKSCRVNALRLVYPSPTEGRLGGFRVLAVMQKAAVNIHARVFCVGRQVLVSLVKYPGAQFLDRAGKARLALQAAASLSCKAAVWCGSASRAAAKESAFCSTNTGVRRRPCPGFWPLQQVRSRISL